MYFNIKNKFKPLIISSVKSYLQYLERGEFNPEYVDAIRSLLGKLLKEKDWSYILLPVNEKVRVGKVVVIDSTVGIFKRNSQWTLKSNSSIELKTLFKTIEYDLFETLKSVSIEEEEYSTKKDTGMLLFLRLEDNNYLKLLAGEKEFKTLTKTAQFMNDVAVVYRLLPTIAMVDAIAFYIENGNNSNSIRKNLISIRDNLIDTYGFHPVIPQSKKDAPPMKRDFLQTKDEINVSLYPKDFSIVIKTLLTYCELMERFYAENNSTESCNELEKIAEVKKIALRLKNIERQNSIRNN